MRDQANPFQQRPQTGGLGQSGDVEIGRRRGAGEQRRRYGGLGTASGDQGAFAIGLKEDNADAYFIRAKARMMMKKYRAAVDDYNSVLYISLDNTKVYAHRAYAESFIPDEKDRMNADFSYAVKVEPKNPDTFYLRGLAKLHLNDKTGCNDLNTAVSLGSKAAQEDLKKYCH